MKRIGITIAVLVVLCMTLFAFQNPLMRWLLKWQLRSYAQSSWGADLNIDHITSTDKGWKIENPKLLWTNPNAPHIIAKAIFIETDISWWKRLLIFQIAIEKPEWHFTSSEESFYSFASAFPLPAYAFLGIFRVEGHIAIHKGNIHLLDTHDLTFSADGKWRKQYKEGSLQCWPKGENASQLCLEAKWTTEGRSLSSFSMKCNSFDCAFLNHVIPYFGWQKFLPKVKGYLKGTYFWSSQKGKTPQFEGSGEIHQFRINYPETDFHLEVPVVSIKAETDTGISLAIPGTSLLLSISNGSEAGVHIFSEGQFGDLRPLISTQLPKSIDTSRFSIKAALTQSNGQLDINNIIVQNAEYITPEGIPIFSDLHATVQVHKDTVNIRDLELFYNEAYIAGNATVRCSNLNDGYLNIDLNLPIFSGRVSQLRSLNPLLSLPFEGNLSFINEGASLQCAITSKGYQVQGTIQGVLSEGSFLLPGKEMSVHDLSCSFKCDPDKRHLTLSDIQGSLILGSPTHSEEYTIASDQIRFLNYEKLEGKFDLWIGDRSHDFLRLVGEIKPLVQSNGTNRSEIVLDNHLSHFGNINPSRFHLVIRNGSHIEDFSFQAQFSLGALLRTMQRFNKTGIFFFSRSLLHNLGTLDNIEGQCTTKLQYDPHTSTFYYQTSVDNLTLGNKQWPYCIISGKHKDVIWSIDQLQIGNFSLAADFFHENDQWKFPFLGIRYGQNFLLGMNGNLISHSNTFEGILDICELPGIKKDGDIGVKMTLDRNGICISCSKKTPLSDWKTLQMQISPQQTTFHIEGSLGRMEANGIEIDTDPSNELPVRASLVKIRDFHPNAEFTIDNGTIEEFQAKNLKDFSTFEGHGSFHFVNALPGKGALSIPDASVKQTGINPSLFQPEAGTVYYHMKDGFIYFDKFKDVYSQDQLSKFTLERDGLPSSIGLDGTLNLNVRMQPRSALLKIADRLLINVEGTFHHPVFHIKTKN